MYGPFRNGMIMTLGTLMVIVGPEYVRLTQPSKTMKEIFSLSGFDEPMAE